VSVLILVALMQMFTAIWNQPPASLGELARREAVRRRAMPPPARSMTNADLGPMPVRPPARRAGSTPAGAADVPPPPRQMPTDQPTRDEAWWHARMESAMAALERDRVLVAALESRIAALTRDVSNRDDPVQRASLMADRVRAVAELDRMRLQIDTDTQALAALEEEARTAGVLPGGLRMSCCGSAAGAS